MSQYLSEVRLNPDWIRKKKSQASPKKADSTCQGNNSLQTERLAARVSTFLWVMRHFSLGTQCCLLTLPILLLLNKELRLTKTSSRLLKHTVMEFTSSPTRCLILIYTHLKAEFYLACDAHNEISSPKANEKDSLLAISGSFIHSL